MVARGDSIIFAPSLGHPPINSTMRCCYVDELEGQRRELEARRAMLEERFKLRLATAQVYSSITSNSMRLHDIFAFVYEAAHASTHQSLQIDLELHPTRGDTDSTPAVVCIWHQQAVTLWHL